MKGEMNKVSRKFTIRSWHRKKTAVKKRRKSTRSISFRPTYSAGHVVAQSVETWKNFDRRGADVGNGTLFFSNLFHTAVQKVANLLQSFGSNWVLFESVYCFRIPSDILSQRLCNHYYQTLTDSVAVDAGGRLLGAWKRSAIFNKLRYTAFR